MHKTFKIGLLLLMFIWLSPFYWTLSLSLGHYNALFENKLFLYSLRNSLVIALLTSGTVVGIASWSAYQMTRHKLKLTKITLILALIISLYPQVAVASPLFLLFRKIGLINTWLGLIILYTTFSLPLILFFLYSYFQKIPIEMDEAAAVDGASTWTIYSRIVMPQAIGALATAFVLVFLFVWNEFFLGLVLTIDERARPLPTALALFTSRYETNWGELSAAAVIAALPVFVFCLFTKRVFFADDKGAKK